MREVDFWFSVIKQKTEKPFYSIHLKDVDIMETMFEAKTMYEKQFLKENRKLLDYFDVETTFLKYSQPNMIEILLENISIHPVIDDRLVYKIKDRMHEKLDVVFLGKESAFTNSLVLGIESYFSQKTHIHFSKYIVSKETTDIEAKFISFLEEEQNNADAFLIRPYKEMTMYLAQKIKLLLTKKKVVLIDRDLNDEQKRMFHDELPLFISSNFKKGGEMIADEIISYTSALEEKVEVYIFGGPMTIDSSALRIQALIHRLKESQKAVPRVHIKTETFSDEINKEIKRGNLYENQYSK